MRTRRISTVMLSAVLAVTGVPLMATSASAAVDCGDGVNYVVTDVNKHFVVADRVGATNRTNKTATLKYSVSSTQTSTKSFTGTITVGVEAGFWVFAKAKAEASASVTLQNTMSWTTSQEVSAKVGPGETVYVEFGFRKYDQYIRSYRMVNTSQTSCGRDYLQEGWVRGPYDKHFVIRY